MSTKELPLSRTEFETLVYKRAHISDNIVFTDHCLERLEQREVTLIEAQRCLRRGCIVGSIEYSPELNTWKFRIQEQPPRDIICLVAAVSLDPTSRVIIAITVWEI